MSTFGQRLKEEREKKGYSQKDFADAIEVTPTRLNYWEKDKREPDFFNIRRIVDVLKIDADYLLLGESLENEKPSGPETSESEDIINARAVKLYRALLNSGFVKEGQELTAQQIDFLDGICSVISAFFDQSN